MTLIPKPPRRARPDFSLTTVNIVFLLLLFYLATGTLVTRNELEADIPITKDLPLERWYREMRIRRVGEGPSEVQRMVIAREILGSNLR